MTSTETVIASGLRLQCSRDSLISALGVVVRGVSSRSAVQILSGVLLRVEERLELSATDMELSLRTSVEAQVEGQGSVVVPARLLVEVVRLLPNESVAI